MCSDTACCLEWLSGLTLECLLLVGCSSSEGAKHGLENGRERPCCICLALGGRHCWCLYSAVGSLWEGETEGVFRSCQPALGYCGSWFFQQSSSKQLCCWEVLHTDRAQPFSCSSISKTPSTSLVWACKITCFSAVVEFWTKLVPHSLTCCLFLQQSLTFLEAQKEHPKNAKLFALCPFYCSPKAAFAFVPVASAFWAQCSSGPAAGCLPQLSEQAVADPGRSPFSRQWRRQCLLTCPQR